VRKTGYHDPLMPSLMFDMYRRTLFYDLRKVHRCGIAHGDFAPRNVVLDTIGQTTLIDFESATECHQCPGDGSCEELARAARELGLVFGKDLDREFVG
jgi:RIO-like serine/threonine protein kinase